MAVRDRRAPTRVYVDVLGFARDFGDGSDGWSFRSRGALGVMLGECAGATPAGELGDHSWVAHVTVDGVDELRRDVARRGAEVLPAPATGPWGLREFSPRTPDGHRLVFGQPAPAGG